MMEKSAAKLLWNIIMQEISLQEGNKDMIKKTWNIMLSNEEGLLKKQARIFSRRSLRGVEN